MTPHRPSRSRRFAAALGAALALGCAAPARADDVSCQAAGAEAERDWGLPAGLIDAIGKVESGRADPATGTVAAWPWSINAAGVGKQFPLKDLAVRTTTILLDQGVRSIDVGCFQINLMHHPAAFSTLEEAFDPRANAQYAARFLAELHGRTGSWEGAIGAYHSANPGPGDAYRARVLAAWSGARQPGRAVAGGGVMIPVQAAPAAPPRAAAAGPVWSVSTQAMGISIWTPGTAAAGTNVGLPRVFAGRP